MNERIKQLRRGDILRCIETDELCAVWATSTSGKTLVKWAGNDFGTYTADQVGELFCLEPKYSEDDEPLYTKPQWQGLTDDEVHELTKNVIAFKSDVVKFIRAAEAKLKEKNT